MTIDFCAKVILMIGIISFLVGGILQARTDIYSSIVAILFAISNYIIFFKK